jgi:hypothetical protein
MKWICPVGGNEATVLIDFKIVAPRKIARHFRIGKELIYETAALRWKWTG